MPGGLEKAGLLFEIKANSSQGEAEVKRFFNSLTRQAHEAGAEAVGGLGPLGGALTSLAGPAAVAATAIAGIGVAIGAVAVAAVGVTEKLFHMAESAASLGGEFAKFQNITGLSATTVSALNYAATLSGKSLNELIPALGFFTKTMRGAQDETSKAGIAMHKLGVTDLHDLDHALAQSIDGLNKMADGADKMNASADIFGRRTGKEMLNLLKKMPEGLSGMEAEAKKLGLTLSQDDIKAAKEFNHAMETLDLQLKLGAARFALQYAPQIATAIESVSRFLADNQEVAREWGRNIVLIIDLVKNAITGIGGALQTTLDAFNKFFGTNIKGWQAWSATVRSIAAVTSFGITELIRRAMDTQAKGTLATYAGRTAREGSGGSGDAAIDSPGGGGKGGKGGKGRGKGGGADNSAAKSELENQIELQKIALQRLEKAYTETMDKIREEFKKTDDQGLFSKNSQEAIDAYRDKILVVRAKILDLADALGTLDKESESKLRVRLAKQFDDAIKLSDKLVKDNDKNNKLIVKSTEENDKKVLELRKKLHDDLKQLDDDQRAFAIEGAQLDADMAIEAAQRTLDDEDSDKKQREQANIDIMNARGKLANFLTQDLRSRYQNEQDELNLEETARKKEIEDTVKDETERQTKLEAITKLFHDRRVLSEAEFQRKLAAIEAGAAVKVGGRKPLGDAFDEIGKQIKDNLSGSTLAVATFGLQAMTQVFSQLGQAAGDAVKAFVLFGSSGGNFRKFAAEMIASIAQMATVQAIYELAQGLAWLALNFFLPNPQYVLAANTAFASAAAFGLIAGGAALIGRGVAGNAFKDQAGAATGTGAPAQTPQNNYGTPFTGFGGGTNGPGTNSLTGTLTKLNQTQAALEETVHKLASKIEGISPGDVVSMGAGDASDSIRSAYESELSNSGGRATANFQRATGGYR